MISRARSTSLLAAVVALALVACGGGGPGGAHTTLAADSGAGAGAGGDTTGTVGSGAVGSGAGEGSGTGEGADAGGGATTTEPTLVAIVLSPENPLIVLEDGSAPFPFVARGVYSDDSEAPITADVAWAAYDQADEGDALSAPDEDVLAIGADGFATAVAPGTAMVTATLGDLSASTTVTVSLPPPAPTLAYISLERGSVQGSTSVIGTIHLTPVEEGGQYLVRLSASDNNADLECGAVTPAEVLISAPETTGTFTVTTAQLPTPGARKCKVVVTATLDVEDGTTATKTASLNVRR